MQDWHDHRLRPPKGRYQAEFNHIPKVKNVYFLPKFTESLRTVESITTAYCICRDKFTAIDAVH